MQRVIGFFDIDVEGRFEYTRNVETNSSNFISDLLRTHFDNIDLTLLTAGTLRTNHVLQAGDITMRALHDLIPFADKVILLRVPGDTVLQLLENSVSKWPAYEGRFSCISGLKYSFDTE